MSSVNPKLIFILIAAILLFLFLKITNPYQKYGTESFWEIASVEDVYDIPDEALLPGNKNGPVLMWAASATTNVDVISAIISRGVDVNEREVDFKGTALTAAASQNPEPSIIDELVRHGANVNLILGFNDATPLIMAAQFNENERITERLLHHGANPDYKDANGRTAYMHAVKYKNKSVIAFYKKLEN